MKENTDLPPGFFLRIFRAFCDPKLLDCIENAGISILTGAPFSYFVNKLWLENFPNRVEFGAGTVILGSSVLLILGILTISSQALRFSRTKVVDTLKME